MQPILTPLEMAAVDRAAPEPIEELIDRAGSAVARAALDMLGGAYGRVVVVLAGKGNNGNDGRVAADVLRRRGVAVDVIDAVDAGSAPRRLGPADLVIDAAFGTGFRGEWQAPDVGDARVLAVDIPSGVDALTGEVAGSGLAAERTVTFQALKPGLLFGAGAALAGRIDIADIGLDMTDPGRGSGLAVGSGSSWAGCHRVERSDVAAWWPTRPVDTHKWRSAVRVVAGSVGMSGAASLAATASARAGAGLVRLSAPGLHVECRPEIVQDVLPADSWADAVLADLDRFGALAIGPGLGREPHCRAEIVRCVAHAGRPTVVDGDGLFALAHATGGAAAVLGQRSEPTVLTPHDGEFRELTGALPGSDRVAATRSLAEAMQCTVLLKGPTTVVADADGRVLVSDHGDQRLATAGSGDVLTGIIATALASGLDPVEAAAAAAWLHAEAGAHSPRWGMLAGDLVESLSSALAGVLSSQWK